jgi:SAM-dependent methyltransferase
LTAAGELAEGRDFATYGAQMDASLQTKLDDLLPAIRPGRIVDKGCGTGKLVAALAQRFPTSALVGVDLSAEMLRRCAALGVPGVVWQRGDAALPAAPAVAPGTASTVVFSSILHEVHTYSGYDRERVRLALRSAAVDLAPGGRLLIRDGLSPGDEPVVLGLHDAATRARFALFASAFRRGAGAPHEVLDAGRVRLSAHLANEFLCKKDYLINWDIEVHEEFGPFTAAQWARELVAAGLHLVSVQSHWNPWILANRYAGKATVTDLDGAPLPWPATHGVVVAERPG